MDALKNIEEKGYMPYSYSDLVLAEIYKKLCAIETTLRNTGQTDGIEQAEDGDSETSVPEAEYNSVVVNATNNIKVSHSDDSYTQMTGNGFFKEETVQPEETAQTEQPEETKPVKAAPTKKKSTKKRPARKKTANKSVKKAGA